MKTTRLYKILLILFSFVAIVSCQKVVVLDLNTADSRIVIEGNITKNVGPKTVYVTTSGSFYTGDGIGPIDDATVVFSDDEGNIDTLAMYAPGIYYTYEMDGRANVEYTIEVLHDGVVYTGSELFPEKKLIDSLSYVVNEGIFGDGLNEDGDTTYNIICRFQDPEDTFDYYRFVVQLNDSLVQSGFRTYTITDDELFNGQLFDFEITGTGAIKGDTMEIELQSTGYNTYKYYSGLNDAVSGGTGSTPYNPITNLNNDALGYFGAYTSDSRTIIIE